LTKSYEEKKVEFANFQNVTCKSQSVDISVEEDVKRRQLQENPSTIANATKDREFQSPVPPTSAQRLFGHQPLYKTQSVQNIGSVRASAMVQKGTKFLRWVDAQTNILLQKSLFSQSQANLSSVRQLQNEEMETHSLVKSDSKFMVLRRLKERVKVAEVAFFEQFFVIGCDAEALEECLEPGALSCQVRPQNLLQLKEDFGKEEGEMLLDFAFPTGVNAQRLNVDAAAPEQKQAAEQDLEKVLWGSKNWRENMFVVSLNFDEADPQPNAFEPNQKTWLLCVTFDQILRLADGSLWLVERAYGMVVKNNYFQCHCEILECVLRSKKTWFLEEMER